ncbi:unnamed protein product, partial [Ilex paraguariensis]
MVNMETFGLDLNHLMSIFKESETYRALAFFATMSEFIINVLCKNLGSFLMVAVASPSNSVKRVRRIETLLTTVVVVELKKEEKDGEDEDNCKDKNKYYEEGMTMEYLTTEETMGEILGGGGSGGYGV